MVNFKCSKCNKKTKHELTSEGWAGRQWTKDFTCTTCGECISKDSKPPQIQTQYFVLSTEY